MYQALGTINKCVVTVEGGEMSEKEASVYIQLKIQEYRLPPTSVHFKIDGNMIDAKWTYSDEQLNRFSRLVERKDI